MIKPTYHIVRHDRAFESKKGLLVGVRRVYEPTLLDIPSWDLGLHAILLSVKMETCGACGHVHAKLGSNKVFTCPSCGFTTGRDVNGLFCTTRDGE